MDADGHRSKRRKTKATNSNIIKIGNKSIDLTAYLQAQPKKAQEPEQRPPVTGKAAASEDEGNSESLKKDKIKKTKDAKDSPLLKARKALPIWPHQDDIKTSLRGKDNDVVLIVGETGSGKSTQVPQFLCDEPWCRRKKVEVDGKTINVGGMIAITQPRRVAATTLAARVAREMGTPIGTSREGSVGYSVRFDHNVPKGTKIKFLTEGMLLQELLRDPYLRHYNAVIIDEIHERSVDVDLIAGFLKQILSEEKKKRGGIPLKVVVMSATADVEKIQEFFYSQKLLRIKGRQYPVDIKYTNQPVPDLHEALIDQILSIHKQEPLPGDILAFLPGQEQIESAQRMIEEHSAAFASDVPKLAVFPLYGQLSIKAQQEAFMPLKGFTRKVVLATNIAETSVTVPGVRCGKAKIKHFRIRLGMESLLAKPISKSSAIQRTGRAGREGPGKCYRLYTSETYNSLKEVDLPEILRNDVLGAVLTMKARGINDILAFPLMDAPEVEALEKALVHLHFLGAIRDDGTITDVGRKLAMFPVSAPYGRVLLAAAEPEYDCLLEVIDVVACITAGDSIFHQLQFESEEVREEVEDLRRELYRREGDILTYLTTMQRYAALEEDKTIPATDRIEWCRRRRINMRTIRQAKNVQRQLRGICIKEKLLSSSTLNDPEEHQGGQQQNYTPLSPERADSLLKCFMRGFGLKTALLHPDSSYVTIQGKQTVAIHPSSVLHGQQKKEAIMFLEHVFTQKNYAKKVSAIRADWVVQALGGDA